MKAKKRVMRGIHDTKYMDSPIATVVARDARKLYRLRTARLCVVRETSLAPQEGHSILTKCEATFFPALTLAASHLGQRLRNSI